MTIQIKILRALHIRVVNTTTMTTTMIAGTTQRRCSGDLRAQGPIGKLGSKNKLTGALRRRRPRTHASLAGKFCWSLTLLLFTFLVTRVCAIEIFASSTSCVPNATSVRYSYRSHVLVKGHHVAYTSTENGTVASVATGENNTIDDPDVKRFVPLEAFEENVTNYASKPCSYDSVEEGTAEECAKALTLRRATDDLTTRDKYFCFSNAKLQCGGEQDGPKSLFFRLAQDMYQRNPGRRLQMQRRLLQQHELGITNRRRLGDFDELNAIFKGVVLAIPNQEFSKKIWPSTMKVKMTNILCSQLVIGDMAMVKSGVSATHVSARVSLSSISIVCSVDYRYDWGWFGGNGAASAGGSSQSITTTVELPRPPSQSNANVLQCSSNVDLSTLSFSGGIVSKIANLFKSLFRGKLEETLETVLCDELGTLGSDLLTSLTSGIHEAIFEYVPTENGGTYSSPLGRSKPLTKELQLDPVHQSSLVSWSELLRPDAASHPNNTAGNPEADPIALMGIIPKAFAAADAYLGEEREDGSAEAIEGQPLPTDLGINCFLREQGIVDPATGLLEVDFTNSTNPHGLVFYDGDDPLTHTKIGVRRMQVTGLDKFTKFSPIKVLGHQTFSHGFSLPGRVTMTLESHIYIGPSRLEDSLIAQHQGNVVEETPKITVSFSNLNVDASTFVAVSKDLVLSLKLGSLYEAPIDCVASTVDDLEITKFLATIADIEEPQFSGFLSRGIDRLFSQATHIAFTIYEATMLSAMPGLVETNAVDTVNTLIKEYLGENKINQKVASRRTCPAPSLPFDSGVFVNFSSSNLWQQMEDFALEPLQGEDPKTVNTMIGNMSPGGKWSDPLGLVKVEAGTGEAMLGVVTIQIQNSSLSNLDTIYGLELLSSDPYRFGEQHPNNTIAGVIFDESLRQDEMVSSPYTLSTSLGIGKVDKPLKFSVRMLFKASGGLAIAGGASAFHNDFTFTLEVAKAEMLLQTLMQIDVGSLHNLKLLHFPHPDCWISALKRFGIARARAIVAGFVRAKVTCHSCSSPGFLGLEKTMATVEAKREMTKFVNQFLNKTSQFLEGNRIQEEIDEWVLGAFDRCTNASNGHKPDGTMTGYGEAAATPSDSDRTKGIRDSDFTPSSAANLDYTLFALIGFLLGLIAGCLHLCARERKYQKMLLQKEREIENSSKKDLAKGTHKGRTGSGKPRSALRRSVRWSVDDDYGDGAKGRKFHGKNMNAKTKTTVKCRHTALKTTTITTITVTKPNPTQSPLIASSKSLFRSQNVPCLIRYLVPLLLIVNAALFLSGHLSLGAQVRVKAQVAGETIVLPQVFEFSLAQSTIDMWTSGGKMLAVILVIFSGLWPYAKVSLSLFLWFAPPETYAPSSRGSAYMWLDALGKWSMIDIFVLVLSMVGFHLKILSPALAMLPREFYEFEIQVIPVWGLYANLIAQLVSQLVSHIAIYYHRNVVAHAELTTGFKLLNNKHVKKKKVEQNNHFLTSLAEGIDLTNTSEARTSDISNVETRNPISVETKKQTGKKKSRDKHVEDNKGAPKGMVASRIAHWEKDPRTRKRRATTWVSSTDHVSGPRKALANVRAPLRSHVYEMASGAAPGSGLRLRVQISPCGQLTVILLIVTTSAVLLYGSSIISFYMHTLGMAGIAIELGRESASMEQYSIFSVVEAIAVQADPEPASRAGIWSIAGIFLLCAVIVPFLQLLGLLVMWVVPLSLKNQKRAFLLNESLSAWQYLEVYIIAICVAVLQMGQISAEMAKPICGDLEPTFALLTDMGLLDEVNSNCFTINSGIEMGTYVLLGGAVSLNILNQLITRAATAAIQDREARLRGDSNPWSVNNQPDSFFRNNLVYFLWFMCCCLRYVGDVGHQEKGDAEESTGEEDSGRVSILSSKSDSSGVQRKQTLFSRRRVSTAVYIPEGKGDLPPVSQPVCVNRYTISQPLLSHVASFACRFGNFLTHSQHKFAIMELLSTALGSRADR